MKYLKYFLLGLLLGVALIVYPIYVFHQDNTLDNIVPPATTNAINPPMKSFNFYEGEHYKLTRQEILYYLQNTKFTKGNPLKPPITEEELGDSTILKDMPAEITNFLKNMRLPVDEEYFQISSNYGLRTDPVTGEEDVQHWGIDIAAPGIEGSNVYAVMDGVVEFASIRNIYGNLIIISHHSGKIKTYYAHLGTIKDIVPGDQIKRGQVIGTVGNTGKSTGPHLHFEVHVPVNPAQFLAK